MTDKSLDEDLARVLETLAAATPGDWGLQDGTSLGKPWVILAQHPDGWPEYVAITQNVHYATGRNDPNARGIVDAVNFLRTHGPAIQSALADQRRLREAATGTCMEVGDLVHPEAGEFCGAIIQSTRDELRRGGPIVYRRIAIVPLDQEGE
jgi:hypothetical protein